MTPLQYAVRTTIDSSTFSFRSPAIAEEVWTSIQAAPDSVCEEFLIVGEHVLRTCFLSLMLKREVAHPNGFLTTVRDAVLSPDVYAALVTKAGLHWRGPTARPATDAFSIFVAALHMSLDNYLDVLDWFREIFIPLIRVAEEMYYKTSGNTSERNPDTYAPALDLLAQIKLVWSTSSFAGRELATFTGAAMTPVIRIAGTALRASIPLKWTRSRKLNESLRRDKFTRRVSSILDTRPSVPSRAHLNSELDPCVSAAQDPCAKATEIPLPTRVFPPNSAPCISQATTPSTTTTLTSSLSASSNVRPWRYTGSAQMYAKEVSPAPALRLPPRASYGVRKVSWSEGAPLDSSRLDSF
ncbi:hypothetical protein B0H13DRAFT_2274459 [Mycena leptocephala]|nr:hypothetical protein B0H13DRAFT_2274459 [Mycena leptocephala]